MRLAALSADRADARYMRAHYGAGWRDLERVPCSTPGCLQLMPRTAERCSACECRVLITEFAALLQAQGLPVPPELDIFREA